MKRFCSIFLILAMVFCLVGCGQKEEEESPLKFGLICLHDENSSYDKNFIDAFNAACEVKGVEGIIKTNIPEGNECYEAAGELADGGCSIVFADSFGHEDYMIQVAREFPEVQFCHATGTKAHTEGVSNFHNAFAAIYEGRYIDGVALGMKVNEMIANGDISESEALIGYVGAFQYAEVISGYTAFYLGVKSVCPSVIMKVMFTNSWYDVAAEQEAAKNLINKGCVAISSHADSSGVPSACEEAGVPFVFYNDDVSSLSPNTFIVATKINWQPYFEYIIDCVSTNTPIDTDWTGNFATGSVEMTSINTNVAAEGTEEAINELIDIFKNGNGNVFNCHYFKITNGGYLTSYLADVDSDAEYKGDTEVIKDGIFYESKFRSAPYFDIPIQGIEIM